MALVDDPNRYGSGVWAVNAAGTTAGATATQAAGTATQKQAAMGVQCSGDAACLVTIESPASTVIWRKRFAAAFTHSEQFPVPLVGAAGQAILTKISASTANCEANMQGFTTS